MKREKQRGGEKKKTEREEKNTERERRKTEKIEEERRQREGERGVRVQYTLRDKAQNDRTLLSIPLRVVDPANPKKFATRGI